MSDTDTPRGLLGWLATVFGGWRFAAFAITAVLGFALLMVVVLLTPASPTGFGAFALEFKRWCFDWNGGPTPVFPAVMMISELVLFAGIVAYLWRAPLRDALRSERRSLVRWSGAAVAAVLVASMAMVSLGQPSPVTITVADLRIAVPAPDISLIDHTGAPVEVAEHRGQVLLVTAVYSTCGYTCPMILSQARRAVDSLDEAQRGDLRILAITLDPRHDTQEILAEAAAVQQLPAPLWRLVTGPPDDVERTLDAWNVSRRKNPETGEIDHANLFLLVDRQGRLAFRLGLATDREREDWLVDALRILLDEPSEPPAQAAAAP